MAKKTLTKVLIDARMVTGSPHGIGRYTLNLIRGLHDAGLRVNILSHDETTPEIIGSEFISEVIPCRFRFAHPAETVELSRVVNFADFDLVHFPSFAVPLRMPRNSVVTIHDLIHLYPPFKWTHQIYYRTVVKRALAQCGQVITVSQWSKDEIVGILKTPPEKVHVVRLGLEDRWFQPPSSAAPVAGSYFLALGSPKNHKNIPTLLKACERLWREGKDFSLALSLGGEDWPAQWNLTEGHRPRVKVLKNLKDGELVSYFGHARAVVSPSFYEGYNLPAAEGLAMGKSVIVSSAEANRELQGARLRVYSPPDDDAALARELAACLDRPGETATSRADHEVPDLKTMVKETLKIYEQALDS